MELEDTYKDLDDQMKYILTKYEVEETQLGTKHLAYVIAAMMKVAANWYNIGVSLGVDTGKLDGFRRQYRGDSDRCLVATIYAWLAGSTYRSTKSTWKDVVVAVGSEIAGANPAEAERLAKEKFSSVLGGVPESAGVDTKSLGEAELTKVISALKPVENKWLEIGVFLGLKYSTLKGAYDDGDRDMVTFIAEQFVKKNYMVDTFGEPTWKRLVEAIGSRAGADNPRQAEEIAKSHQAIHVPVVEETDSVTNVELEMQMLCKPGGIATCINKNPTARGLAVVVTNDYGGSLSGTREDATSLCDTFMRAQFIVCDKRNANGDELLQLIEEVKSLKADQVKDYQCILFAFSGHGGHGDDGDQIQMENRENIQVYEQVLAPLLPGSAPELGDIPKVVLTDACRGDEETQTTLVPKQGSSISTEGRQIHPVPSKGNFLIACATLPKHYAYMRPDNLGSAWTQMLTAELKIRTKEDLESVLAKVAGEMVKRAQRDQIEFQAPAKLSTLYGPVYIYPQ